MRILLTSLNAKFIHSNLAIRYLKEYCEGYSSSNIIIREFTINDQIDKILSNIFIEKPNVVGLSCYIWNIEETLKLISSLKQVMPKCKIILGGPEVSFDSRELMEKFPYIDFIIYGEGEDTFRCFIEALENTGDFSSIKGLVYRDGDRVIQNPPRSNIEDIDIIPFPYRDGLLGLENKIIYYETSRGCPFNCQYCLSSTIEGIRYFSLERVLDEIDFFIDNKVSQVKLVDRTFNCHPNRAKVIIEHIIRRGGNTNFHFEMAAHIMDRDMVNLLKEAPQGLFQLEIGVQSTNVYTLDSIQRKTDIDKIYEVVKELYEPRNIHIHLDLIAGLPYEDYESFAHSFDNVYSLKPDNLQLGFLKLLKGSGIREEAIKHGYRYTKYAPYEVLENKYISYGQIMNLKAVEDVVEKYYNSHRFEYTLEFLIPYFGNSPFAFFEEFMKYWIDKRLFNVSHSLTTLYEIIYDFISTIERIPKQIFKEVLRFDYCLWQKPSNYLNCFYPAKLGTDILKNFLTCKENINTYLPEYEGYTRRQLMRALHMEIFEYDPISYIKKETVILFDYKSADRALKGTKFYVLK